MRHIAIIDIGKTNAKLAIVKVQEGEEPQSGANTLHEVAVVTRPNKVLPGPPWPHFDLEAHWTFFLEHLRLFHQRFGIDAISVATHGASAVVLDADLNLAAPMLDYEHPGPDAYAAEYDSLRPGFDETGSPRLAMGLNVGAQLYYMLKTVPNLAEKVAYVMTYPQYWGMRLTGQVACDVTSLGCHTDLWNPWQGRFSSLVDRLGLTGKFAPARNSNEVLGTVLPGITALTGIPEGTPVYCGIHDSNASLYPYVLGRPGPFIIASTGTWVISMAMRGNSVALDPARDTLVNVNALGAAVPSARFMGGREFELVTAGSNATPTEADRERVLADQICLLPAVESTSGPFAGKEMRWTHPPANEGERLVALSYYLALMSDTCFTLIGGRGPVIVEGPFARNRDYLAMLAALRPEGVEIAESATGTSIGAALLALEQAEPPQTHRVTLPDAADHLRNYAAIWRQASATI